MTSAVTSSSVDWETVLRLIPGYDPFATAGDCTFDAAAADRVVGFFADCLVHVKGQWASHKIVLAPWQQAADRPTAAAASWSPAGACDRYR